MPLADPDAQRHRAPHRARSACLAMAALPAIATVAFAGGPRFVTGTAFPNVGPGSMMSFYTPALTYSTDPAALAVNVTHAQADALVAQAAAVWNSPYATLTLSQGGELAEHVSSANAFFNGSQMIFPADVSASNYAAIPIAVIYDSDGSVTDQLLGADASDPSGCRQNGVTSSVDSFSGSGQILHAVVLLNGRCVGSTPQQLTQMEYQVMRAFGRVLGLAWSQLNDNVFTGSPTPTADNESFWPVMHPIDVVCGPYTYQCMQNPFALRLDDISTLALLYPVATTGSPAGKIASLSGSDSLWGQLYFPGLAGMEMVNLTVERIFAGNSYADVSQVVSGVAGSIFAANSGNRISGGETAAQNAGWSAFGQYGPEGEFFLGRIPVTLGTDLLLTTEPINPLYTGSSALGIFQRPVLSMSGSAQTVVGASEWPGQSYVFRFTQPDAAPVCGHSPGGTEIFAMPADPSGLWLDALCTFGRESWYTVTARAGRTVTIEAQALDEQGNATVQKLQPILGVWNAIDPLDGSAPDIASAPYAMNALAPGVTQARIPAASSDTAYRFVVQDQYGAGRQDFAFRARVLYADSVTPSVLGSGGGLLTITGTGFTPGNAVLVNGVRATLVSLTSTQITAYAPTLAASGASLGSPVDVEVLDTFTSGSATISGGVAYSSAPDLLQQISAPASLVTGIASSPLFAVQALASDGIAPAAGAGIVFSVTQGTAVLGCGSSTCIATTDTNGKASVAITGLATGPITVTATESGSSAIVSMTALDTDPTLGLLLNQSQAWVAAGASGTWNLTASPLFNGAPATLLPVTWTASNGAQITPQSTSTTTAGTAAAVVHLNHAAAGTFTVTACAWTTVCATWQVTAVDAAQWTPVMSTGANQIIASTATLAPVSWIITDGAGHALPGATASIYQEVLAYEGPCPAVGPCPSAPVLVQSQASVMADANGDITLTPLQVPGQPQQVNIAIVTGTQGFATLSLHVTP